MNLSRNSSWFYLLLIIWSVMITEGVGRIELEIDKRDLFPYETNKSFGIYLINKTPRMDVSDSAHDTMVILIRKTDGSNDELERAIFDYGFKDMIDQTYKGEYMTIPVWKKIHEGQAINISILFSRKAYNQSLEVYQLPAKTSAERRRMLSSLDGAVLLIRDMLDLLVPPWLEFTIQSPDGRKNELSVGEIGTAMCRSFDGKPAKEPILEGLGELLVTWSKFMPERNERVAHFRVSLLDHKKQLVCHAGESTAALVLYVLHHATQVTLDPEPGATLANGSSVLCVAADGHPAPTMRWIFVSGPQNASRYFTITDGDTRFTLAKNAPLRTQWTLNCTATNSIPGSMLQFNRTITFRVERVQEGLFDRLNLTTKIIIGVVVVTASVLFCTIVLLIICIVRRCYIGRDTTSTSRKNGVPSKAATKDKCFEAEQVTLLQLSCPPNYVDLSINGSGLPPPPPDYDLTLPDDRQHAAVNPENEQDNDTVQQYNEVTYAELNTSHLPMKNSPSPPPASSSCNDDQVIHSQIVGTVSNQYNAQRAHTEPNNV